jgi:hypothetical protein
MPDNQSYMAGQHDFQIEQGATFRKTILWKDENGNPIDLTGCSARLKAKHGTAELFSLTDGDGITLGADEGTIDLYISDEDTADLDFTLARYDLEIEFPNGDVKRLLKGAALLTREVTV